MAFYIPTRAEVKYAAEQLVEIGHTQIHKEGSVSSDQVRAYIVQRTGQTVNGMSVSAILRSLYINPVKGYYKVSK